MDIIDLIPWHQGGRIRPPWNYKSWCQWPCDTAISSETLQMTMWSQIAPWPRETGTSSPASGDTHTSTHTSTHASFDETASTLSENIKRLVSCCDWHIWKERKGNDVGGRFEESSQFPWIFSYTSHYWRLGKNEISELTPSSSPEISSDRERASGVWWVCQINVKNLPELAPRKRSAEKL